MFDDSLSVAEMKFLVALGDIFDEHGGRPMNFDELTAELKDRGFPVGNGLSRELDDLEEKLGGIRAKGKLVLDRKRKGSTFRSTGLELCASFRELLGKLDEIQAAQKESRTVVRIGMTNALTMNVLPRVFRETSFRKEFPLVDVTVVEGEPHELVQMLSARVDFAIGPRDVANGCRSEFLCEWRRVLLYNASVTYKHDFSKKPSIPALQEWIREETLIIPARRIMPDLDHFLKPMLPGGHRILLPQAAVRRSWVEQGIGIAIAHEEKRGPGGPKGPSDQIRSIDLSSELGTTEMHFFFRKTGTLSPAAQYLVDGIRRIYTPEGDGTASSSGTGKA